MLLTTREFALDRADPHFGSDGRRRSPYGLVQELLNASPEAVWGIVANGTRLRTLRDNPSLTRPAFVEADLELVFGEQLYADFAALWLLAHASRFRPRGGNPEDTILEGWRKEAHETGQRALDELRHGVARASRGLGNGFLQHRANERLRQQVTEGRLSAERYFQELLRLVYRLLFLFTAEERDLVHAPQATAEQREVYAGGYGLARLRERARKRRHYDHHHDLWEGLRILFRCLERGEPRLGLPALGGLFARDQCPNLDDARIANADLLAAVHDLRFFETSTGLQRVNYRDMDSEELGSVYESLLELHPVIVVDAMPWRFEFRGWSNGETSKGHERKLTGSYYTPAPLVHALIESALLPVMAAAVKARPEDPRAALLELSILDPACGSGHFLWAAARRLAAELARLESGTDVPDGLARRHALRQVVQRCLFGVDRNPLAVELCRTALWIETLEPGKPLGFLDQRIRCGDSLVGVLDLAQLEAGIPDAAYAPLTGDDREVAAYYRNKNRRERQEAAQIARGFEFAPQADLARELGALAQRPEDTAEQVEEKRRRFRDLTGEGSAAFRLEQAFDLWTAAWFLPKRRSEHHAGADGLPRRGAETVPTSAAPRAVGRRAASLGWGLG